MAAAGCVRRRRLVSAVALAAALLVAPVAAAADPVTLRLATVAPTGTGWARELEAFARDVATDSGGSLRIKIYFAGIAGDERVVLDRIKREQIDGSVGSEMCMHISQAMRITRIVGLFQSRDESSYVVTRLKPTIDAEFQRAGFVNLGEATLGPEVLFTREPVRDVRDLRRLRFWVWDLDESLRRQARALGIQMVPGALDQAARLYDDKKTDGFIAIPTAALAWQWSTQAHYLEDLRVTYRSGCLFFANRAIDALPLESQAALRAAAAKLRMRMDELGRREDELLLGGLLAKQGLQTVRVSERFRAEFFDVAREARSRAPGAVVPDALLQTVLSWLADYRAEHTLP